MPGALGIDVLGRHVRDALAHLYDQQYLRKHPIGSLLLDPQQAASADGLRQLLLDAIEQLRPPEPCPPTAPTWRQYRYLILRYVEAVKPERIARELRISVRQARREHSQALDKLTSILWDHHLGVVGHKPSERPTLPVEPGNDGGLVASGGAAGALAEDSHGELLKIGSLPPREPTSVAEALRDALGTVAGLVELRRARVELEVPASLPRVWVHRLVLCQVLIDVLSSAVESHRQAQVRVSTTSSTRGVALEVAVPDCRAGRSSPPLDNEARLAASKTLIGLQGGSLATAAREGYAFWATLLLPLARTRTLLVIDDNPDVAYLFSRFLRDHSCRVLQASTGEVALQLARTARPDVITLDVLMPSQSGWDILRELGRDPATRHIPIVVCSVLPERSVALSLGVAGFLNKPVTQQALLDVLRRCLPPAE